MFPMVFHCFRSGPIEGIIVIIDQNYFQFMGQTYVQHDGLTMGAPTSSILSEFYLQHLENSKIYDILRNLNIVGTSDTWTNFSLYTMRGKQT